MKTYKDRNTQSRIYETQLKKLRRKLVMMQPSTGNKQQKSPQINSSSVHVMELEKEEKKMKVVEGKK